MFKLNHVLEFHLIEYLQKNGSNVERIFQGCYHYGKALGEKLRNGI